MQFKPKKNEHHRTSKYPQLAEIRQHRHHLALGRRRGFLEAVLGILHPAFRFGKGNGKRNPCPATREAPRNGQRKGESRPRVSRTRRAVHLHQPEGVTV